MDHSTDHSAHHEEEKGLFYTYFGENGSATVAFVIFLILLTFIFSFIKWG